ncbi:MAG: hypothetical protein FVQ81_15130 [Candidatus Glassbacteria bacterium]|nr:hypothetical protein [Candidatus Glassbacteria bacterium]
MTAELVRRGYTEGQIKLIWSRNLMRAWCEVENVARRMAQNQGKTRGGQARLLR